MPLLLWALRNKNIFLGAWTFLKRDYGPLAGRWRDQVEWLSPIKGCKTSCENLFLKIILLKVPLA